MDQTLADYVKEKLRSGASLDFIKQELLTAGWQAAAVNEALEEINRGRRSRKWLYIGVILVITAGIIVWQWNLIGFMAKLTYYYATDPGETVQQPNNVEVFSLKHETALESIGITVEQKPGNAADKFIEYFGFFEKPGLWAKKYGHLKEDQINLDEEDERYVLEMAAMKDFSLYPEHLKIDPNPFEFLGILFAPRDIGIFGRRLVKYSENLSDDRAEKLLKAWIAVGRKLSESEDVNLLQWKVGAELVEEVGGTALKELYEKKGAAEMAAKISAYLVEIKDLKEKATVLFYSASNLMTYGITLLELSDKLSDKAFVRASLKTLGTSEEELLETLDRFNTDEIIVQNSAIGALVVFRLLDNLQPEHQKVMALLHRYGNSRSDVVSNFAKNSLTSSREKILGDINSMKVGN